VSDNGNSFTNVFTGTSSGTTTSPEKYTMPAGTEGRYLRITVNGNTENNWASITEIAVIGGSIFGDTIGSLSHKWQTNPGSSTWSEYASLNGAIKDESDPAIIANADGRLQAFVVGADNALYYKSQISAGSNTWSEWQPLSGALRDNSNPAVVRNSDGRLQVFVIGPSNTLFYKSQISAGSNTWSEWQSLGGNIDPNTSPVAARNSDGRLQVFVVGADNALYYKSQISAGSNTWSEWQPLSGALRDNSNPAVILNFDGRLETFVIGSGSNSVFHKFQNSPGSTDWSPYDSLGGGVRFNSSPDSLCRETEFQLVFTTYCQQLPLQIFVIGFDNGLYHTWRDTP
jgi:Tfp pilus assembly protein FimT